MDAKDGLKDFEAFLFRFHYPDELAPFFEAQIADAFAALEHHQRKGVKRFLDALLREGSAQDLAAAWKVVPCMTYITDEASLQTLFAEISAKADAMIAAHRKQRSDLRHGHHKAPHAHRGRRGD